MYLQILKNDMKRKRTMNAILLIFVILAATFVASSANNLITVSSALDDFFEMAGVPDYWFASTNSSDIKRFEALAKENGYRYDIANLIQITPKNVKVEGETLEYSNTLALSTLSGIKIFDKNNQEITHIADGEMYVTNAIFQSKDNDFHEGGKIFIHENGVKKEFTLKGYTKDALFGSSMVGMTRFLVSENDAKQFRESKNATICSAVEVHTDDQSYRDEFNALGINTVMSIDRSMFKMVYIMDILIAAILLVVSVCLILISMVILRFIIHFTITEEFREIGVMKAIGLKNHAIRGLYIVKYLGISVIGTFVGLCLSFPFSRMMLNGISDKIVLDGESHFFINVWAAIGSGAAVVLFCYLCTRKIRRFSPIDAIRSGETGERYRKKGMLRLWKSHLPTLPFMALNDILSGLKSYVSMILIFIIGTLLVIIPVNAINTLRCDHLITTFNMAQSDHVISIEMLFHPMEDNEAKIERQFSEIKQMFSENGIDVDVFQEIMFRSNLRKGKKRTNSLTFQGRGDVTADQYAYLKGTPPQNEHEVALTYLTADQIDAKIGDDIEIKVGETAKNYTVTAITQSLNNMGEGVRFYQNAKLDYAYAAGGFGIQVNYKDDPDKETLAERKKMLENLYPQTNVYTPGEYISYMIGADVAGKLEDMKLLILGIILSINALVAILMVKSFIAKEKSEIALLKAIGFQNHSLVSVQTMRIGITLLISVIAGAVLSSPLSTALITPIFHMMGAYRIDYEIRPLEVYAIYPLIVLTVTALAASLSAQGLRRIASFEISDNE